jgi:ubiquinone/menaquinone biosynthesis C-methylase UbiE
MSTPHEPDKSTYVLDQESAAEMARLIRQDRLLTQGMGGLFPERADMAGIHHVLDIGCGPGGWALDVAFAYPEIEVLGIDISRTMIEYARAQGRVQGLENATFRLMSALKPLDLPDGSFDLVNARGVALWLPPASWPAFMQECLRVLRPGGVVRLTDYETSLINTPAFERLHYLFTQAMARVGQTFSPNGIHIGLIPMLAYFLRQAGCQDIRQVAYPIDFSAGTEANESFYHDMVLIFQGAEPFLLNAKVTTREEFEQLFQQMQIELLSEEFRTLWMVVTAWGQKPA